jgi:uncharacterized repeat protein (TIGR04076 family)
VIGLARVKINVIKRVDPKVIFGENVPINPMTGRMFEICSKFKEGQEFIVDCCGEMPEGFCSWAWRDIYKDLSVLQYGGDYPWTNEGEMVTCCTDGIRPVSFRMTRI